MSTQRPRWGWAAGLCALSLGCRDPDPSMAHTEIGDPCRTETWSSCTDADTQRACVDSSWADVDCDDVCATEGVDLVSLGCVVEAHTLGACACTPASGAECEPYSLACDGTELLECSEHSQWLVTPCDEICGGGPVPLISLGCSATAQDASCVCSAQGTPCDVPGEVVCAGQASLARCETTGWNLTPCAQCPAGSMPTCDPFATGGPACTCAPAGAP